ncbi:MAG TPA: hypothetical protein VKD67_03615, partial [Acidimicrobiales bacterium]|nr:hypothetical protein [Acidimicrobiales bacterium]
ELQGVLIEAMFDSLTGFSIDVHTVAPIEPEEFARGLADRNAIFRTRVVQVMLLPALVLRPLPEDVADRVAAFAAALSVDEGMLAVAHRFSTGALGLAAFDFDRNGYTADWSPERASYLHTSGALASAWEQCVHDDALAARWAALECCAEGTLGRGVWEFYRARGFTFPGRLGSAPPLLAQHDWVHVLADYGTTLPNEMEVFALIARANDDPHGFSLLAMVVSLFETGYLRTGAGLFEYSPGQMERAGVAVRMADAMRRGAFAHTTTSTSVDFLTVDWFDLADLTVEEAQAHFGLVPKSDKAIAAGSVGPWAPGGISPFQWKAGHAMAEQAHTEYDSYGASVE